jgi:hypothetical protein
MTCVNKNIPTRTPKEYRTDNKEQISRKGKEYYEKNIDSIRRKTSKYKVDNKDKVNAYNREYKKQKTHCDCGSVYRKTDKKRHEDSKRNQKYLLSIEGEQIQYK